MNAIYIFFENNEVRIPFSDYDKSLFTQLVKSKMGHWDNITKQYRISRSNYDPDTLKAALQGRTFIEVGKEAENSITEHGFLAGEQPVTETKTEVSPEIKTDANETASTSDIPAYFSAYWQLKMDEAMCARSYSPKTRKSYIYYNIEFHRWLQKKPEEVSSDDVTRYLAFLDQRKQHSAATLNFNLSAFKFFYCNVIKRYIVTEQKRPKRNKRLPIVLSKSEVERIINSASNPKHRLLLMMVYASGLRVSEVVNLRRDYVDFSRKVIIIDEGKGKKDRHTIMSKMVKDMLAYYYTQYNITDWLFPSYDTNKHITIRTAQHIFKDAVKKAKVEKRVSIHSLRHAFATHLMERGTDICRIRDLLGHNSLRTTEIYTHVSKKKLLSVISPLDTLDQKDDDEEE